MQDDFSWDYGWALLVNSLKLKIPEASGKLLIVLILITKSDYNCDG